MSKSDEDSVDDLLRKVAATDAAPLAVGVPAFAGRYRLGEPLGRGGLGLVHAAWDPELDREVAVKFVRPDRTGGRSGERLQARLRREAQALAQLAHPSVVRVFDVGEVDGQVYLAMERIRGSTLSAWLADHRPSRAEVVAAFHRAGQALAAAHDAGVVHRDFKPDNVLVETTGRVIVVDFGLAHGLEGDSTGGSNPSTPTPPSADPSRLTDTGVVLGTPRYAAPEQRAGAPTTPLSDQYSFCVALYEALAGGLPGSAAADTAAVPDALRRALERGLRDQPERRWPSMRALLSALAGGRSGPKWSRWVVLAVLGVAGAAWAAGGSDRRPSGRADATVPDVDRALRARLAAANALRDGGLRDAALPMLAAIVVDAEAAGDIETSARAELTLGYDALDGGDQPGARAHFAAAFFHAQTAEVYEVAFSAALYLAQLDLAGQGSVSDARSWLEHARALMDHIERPAARSRVLFISGLLRDDVKPALRDFEGALALLDTDPSGNAAWRFETLSSAAEAAKLLSRTDLARAYLERARDVCKDPAAPARCEEYAVRDLGVLELDARNYETSVELLRQAVSGQLGSLGSEHPVTATTRSQLGLALTHLGRLEEALSELTEAIRVFELPHNREHRELATVLEAMGLHHEARGDLAAAERVYQRALATREATVGRDHASTAYTLLRLAATAYQREDYSTALRYALEARRSFGPDAPPLGEAYRVSARSRLALGQVALAHEDATEAVSLLTRSGNPAELAQARFLLAQLSWRDRDHRARAGGLAREAEAFFAGAGEGFAEELAQVQAWRADHDR